MPARAEGLDRRAILLSVLSGVLLFLSFPKFGHWAFAWVSLVPLLYALRGKTYTEGALLGFLTGLIYNIGLIYWVSAVVVNYGHLPLYLGILIMMLLAVYLSLFVALFGALVAWGGKINIPRVMSAPLLWTVLEYGKSNLLTGFPWGNLSQSQYLNLPMIQMADFAGACGVSFLLVFINAVVCDLLERRENSKFAVLTELAVGSILLSAVFSYGLYKQAGIREELSDLPPTRVTIIQGNIDQSVKWDPRFQTETLRIYRELSEQAAAFNPRAIVWPETATPFFFQQTDELQREVVDVAKTAKASLIFGSPSYRRAGGRTYFQNSAFVVSPEGQVVGKYDKVHLVPYGEYVPLRRFFPFIEKLAVGIGDFLPGEGFNALPAAEGRVGIMICYEAIFPEIGRAFKRQGASLLVNLTNDAWFGRSSAPYQHLSMTVFRAVENRLFIVRAANTGISAFISPAGEIYSKTALFETTALHDVVYMIHKETFYSKHGDVFAYLCIVFLMVIFATARWRKG